MKIAAYFLIATGLLICAYLLGPRPQFEAYDNRPLDFEYPLAGLDAYLAARESRVARLKPGNEARILWQRPATKAACAIVYLHGFSASHVEGAPVHRNIAERFGCNLYLPRLPGHGIDSDAAFRGIEPRAWVDEARHAIALGKLIGERVLVMGTSTGATLATYLAAADEKISALIFFSPNFELRDRDTYLLNGPWGSTIARFYFRGEIREWQASDAIKKYWTTRQHVDGLHALRHLVSATMTDDIFAALRQPVFLAYYYRDEEQQDRYVSVARMHEFMRLVATPENKRRSFRAASADAHPIASELWNRNWREVERASADFIESVLALEPRYESGG